MHQDYNAKGEAKDRNGSRKCIVSKLTKSMIDGLENKSVTYNQFQQEYILLREKLS